MYITIIHLCLAFLIGLLPALAGDPITDITWWLIAMPLTVINGISNAYWQTREQ